MVVEFDRESDQNRHWDDEDDQSENIDDDQFAVHQRYNQTQTEG